MYRSIFPILGLMIATLSNASGQASGVVVECDRDCLAKFADQYFGALSRNDPSDLQVTRDVRFTENGRELLLGEGLWLGAGALTFQQAIFDPQTGGIGVQAVVMEHGKPAIMMLRLKVERGAISEVETIVCREGDAGRLYAPQNLTAPSAHFTRWIRPAERNSRFELLAAAEAYWRAFETEGTPEYVRAPFLPDTLRIENGVQTTNIARGGGRPVTAAQQFDEAMFMNARIYDRRYPVVDVEHGVVLSIVRFGRQFDADGNEIPLERQTQVQGSPLVAEFFAVNGGRIREIQAVLISHPPDAPTGW